MSKRTFIKEERTYTAVQIKKLMEDICKEHNIELVSLTAEEGMTGYNYAASTGDIIFLAPFKGKNSLERRLIAFFHELSHCILSSKTPGSIEGYTCNNTSKMQYELNISLLGIAFAKEKYDINFSDDSVEWLLKQNLSYKHSEGGEICDLKNYDEKNYTITMNHLK